jgi:nicotinamidase-related amidase
MKPALLIIDVQNAFLGSGPGAESLQATVPKIQAAIALFRKWSLPVVCIQQIDADHGLQPGVGGFEPPSDLGVLPSDFHIHKLYDNAFNRTPLLDRLREIGVDTVIATGYCAEHCVLSTCRGAEDNDLCALMLQGALASDRPANVGFVEDISETVTMDTLRELLGAEER